jgi:N-acetylmuramoyl-L-alanine amidase
VWSKRGDTSARTTCHVARLVAVTLVLAACSAPKPATQVRGSAAPPLPTYTSSPTALSSTPKATPATSVARPSIVWKPIPFSSLRRKEMAAYSRRHYGLNTYRLVDPRVIVEHVTASATFGPVFAEFSRDVPDYELHELPGLCAHFVIDTDGTIYQLVPLGLMCRHTVGLNYTAFGIEHVGLTDRAVLSNPAQMAASLQLTLWLMARFHISLANVIGHNESLTSPFHRELVARLRCQTHGDWTRADMLRYRAGLSVLARRERVPLGPPQRPPSPRC